LATVKHMIAIATLERIRERVFMTYLESLDQPRREFMLEKQELVSRIWDDMVDFTIFNKGDVGVLLEAGLEVMVENAIDAYTSKG
jgi:hypothetical protein